MKAREVTHHGKKKFMVEYTAAGRRRRKFFDTKAAARNFITEEENKQKNLGNEIAATADAEFIRSCHDMHTKLKAKGHSLKAAFNHFTAYLDSIKDSATLADRVEEFLASKEKTVGKRQHDNLRHRLRRFVSDIGADIHPAEIDPAKAEAWLDSLDASPLTVNHHRAVVRSFYAHALRRAWVKSNPFDAVEKRSYVKSLPGIFTSAQMQILLDHAKESADLTAWVAVGAYAGVRPEEICKLTWDKVHIDTGLIDLTLIGKGARSRLVTIRPILKSILKDIQKLGGPIVKNPKTFQDSRRLRQFRGGLPFDWPHDGLRHSFATYHVAAFRNKNETALQMGDYVSTVDAHYNRPGITQAEALRFWQEEPGEVAKEAAR